MREHAEAVARQIAHGRIQVELGKAPQMQTRKEVLKAWSAIGETLNLQGGAILRSEYDSSQARCHCRCRSGSGRRYKF